jgi:CheY-like chemotaxis protein
MGANLSREEFLRNLRDSGLFSPQELDRTISGTPDSQAADGNALAGGLIAAGRLTPFQVAALRERRFAELVIGNYEVLDRLGAGGMGTVYKARHRRMKRVVALKVLSPSVAQSEKFVQRFQREVEAVARLSHPNIVMAYDADEAEAGHFLVMEFVNGRDLASEVQQRGPLPVREAVDCVAQAARALDYAHSQGIIHRDVKPANLLRDAGGVVKVADLGLARFNDQLGRPPEEAGLTQAGSIMGTVDYMPPEQALGLTNIDHRADVYSLGCTLFHLLAGRPPYQGPTLMAVLLQHREGPLPSLCLARAEVSAELELVFRRMVAKKPGERFGSMAEVVRALEAVPLAAGFVPGLPGLEVAGAADRTLDLPPERQPAAAGLTVLLVEPSRTQAVIVRKYLQELGLPDPATAPSGQKALEVARATLPRVVISAMHLADMTGVELARQVRGEGPLSSTGFILITSQADAQEANALPQADNIVRLAKPFDPQRLSHALAAALGGAARDLPLAGASSRTAAPDAQSHFRVLVVDDSAAARRHIREVLAGLGLRQVVEAADGAEAVTLLRKETFDLVVTDYNMPRLDGPGLVDFIRRQSTAPAVPVIMVTTETDPARLEAVRRLGVSAICDKDFRPEVVRGVLKRLG